MSLTPATRRRLMSLPQVPSVWEGDRRPISLGMAESQGWDISDPKDCVLWMDGVEGVVRAMDVVKPEAGPEAMVRVLLRAMEDPHSPGEPARPQKIIVRDRTLQFFLRGVLQELDITLDYVPELPLVEDLYRSLEQHLTARSPKLDPELAHTLQQQALKLWKLSPWKLLCDHQILAVELNAWDLKTLYVSVMGMLGMEYGILLYRSLESLRRFRNTALHHQSSEDLEEAFMEQDCLFVTYDLLDSGENRLSLNHLSSWDASDQAVSPSFGHVHPLEGMRSFLYDEEGQTVRVALTALIKFFQEVKGEIHPDHLPALSKTYRISLPAISLPTPTQLKPGKKFLSVQVSTLPEISQSLWESSQPPDSPEDDFPIQDDLIPQDSLVSLGMMPWDAVAAMQVNLKTYQASDVNPLGEGLPVILVQTSRPKAVQMIRQIQDGGGLEGIGFNPGEDPLLGDRYDLGILKTEDGHLHLFGEFAHLDPNHISARQKWEKRCKKTQGFCGLVVAKGLKGHSRGNPQPQDILALFEARSLSAPDFGLGLLQLMPTLDVD